MRASGDQIIRSFSKPTISLVERATPLLRPGIYLEPFALRAVGAVREDELLIEQAVDRFTAMGLEWHAEQSRKLLAPT